DISASFFYKEGERGYIDARSQTIALQSRLFFENEFLHIEIESLVDKKRKIQVDGKVLIDTHNKEIFSQLILSFEQQKLAKLFLYAHEEGLSYCLNPLKEIQNTKKILSLIDLPKEIHYWARDAFELTSLDIESLHGFVEFDKVSDFYKNIYAKAKARDLVYAYNPQLDSIHTLYTDLELMDGVLHIRPEKAYSYGMDLDKSWVKIDFTKKEELLTLYLLFEGSLNKDILHILKSYKINIPFYQHSGMITTNLRLLINLTTLDVDAKGNFYTKNGNFDYKDLNLDLSNVRVLLDNNDISIKSMRADYKEYASALVDVAYDAKKSTGNISLHFDSIAYSDYDLFLDASQKPLDVEYTLNPKKNILSIQASKWNFQNKTLLLDSIRTPFDIDTLSLKLPNTTLEIQGNLKADLSGILDIAKQEADLDISLKEFSYQNLELTKVPLDLKLHYLQQTLSLFSEMTVPFKASNAEIQISEPKLILKDHHLQFSTKYLEIDDLFRSKISLDYDSQEKNGSIILKNPHLRDKQEESLCRAKELLFHFNVDQESNLFAHEKKYDIEFTKIQDESKLSLLNLEKLASDCAILQKYRINNGTASMTQITAQSDLHISLDTKYPYKLLSNEKGLVEEYSLKGMYDTSNNALNLTINNVVDISVFKDIRINAQDIGFYLRELIEFLEDIKLNDTNQKKLPLYFEAKNTHIYVSEMRKAPADTLTLSYDEEGLLGATLTHQGAQADFRYKDKEFYLYGDGFNDRFMEEFLAVSKFKGGALSFSMKGSIDEYDGVFYLENTNIIDYTLLNNVFAFVNTIPSLVTFSLPRYSSKGLFVKSGFVNMKAKNRVLDISDIYLESDEMKIFGKGKADYKNDMIDLKLNLRTNVANQASQIPLVGYLIFDGESVSTTLSITGSLEDPQVSSHLAKDIFVAPLNIIKRTLLLPYHLFKGEEKSKK
ncbi:MAG: AsmA-like C-terminal domain-containing protein, partial [Helicobacteraceae bacterium]|nr:AsmA-like C-terminal domain-containing protein [Helicobacteraceae bacterium]